MRFIEGELRTALLNPSESHARATQAYLQRALEKLQVASRGVGGSGLLEACVEFVLQDKVRNHLLLRIESPAPALAISTMELFGQILDMLDQDQLHDFVVGAGFRKITHQLQRLSSCIQLLF